MATTNVSNYDEEYKPEKTVHKRRSSIFHTRIITCDQAADGDELINDEKKLTLEENKSECNVPNDIETFNLKEYIEKLEQERKNWQEEYKKRKIERRILIKEKESVEEQGQILNINILSESERAFLSKRPNYENICKNSQKLLEIALKISILNQLIHKLNQRFMEKIESNISKATRNIIQMSER